MGFWQDFFNTPMSSKKAAKTIVSVQEKTEGSTQGMIPIQDVQNGIVYRQDGKLVSYIRIHSINISLMSDREKTHLCDAITEATNSIDYPYQIYCCERPIDLNQYVDELGKLNSLEKCVHQRTLIDHYLTEALTLSSSGEAKEKRFYLLLTNSGKDKNAEGDLLNQTTLLIQNLQGAKVDCYRCGDREIIEILTLYTRPQTTDFALNFERADLPMHV